MKLFKPTKSQSPVYSDMSIALFVSGYLVVVAIESTSVNYMMVYLQEMMEDVELYGWQVVCEFHAAWLQLIEQGRTAWVETSKKEKLRRLLVWSKPSLGSRAPPRAPPSGGAVPWQPRGQPAPQVQGYMT